MNINTGNITLLVRKSIIVLSLTLGSPKLFTSLSSLSHISISYQAQKLISIFEKKFPMLWNWQINRLPLLWIFLRFILPRLDVDVGLYYQNLWALWTRYINQKCLTCRNGAFRAFALPSSTPFVYWWNAFGTIKATWTQPFLSWASLPLRWIPSKGLPTYLQLKRVLVTEFVMMVLVMKIPNDSAGDGGALQADISWLPFEPPLPATS